MKYLLIVCVLALAGWNAYLQREIQKTKETLSELSDFHYETSQMASGTINSVAEIREWMDAQKSASR